MKSVSELDASDFPGINAEKFYEWKTAVLQIRKNWWLFFAAITALGAVVVPLAGSVAIEVAAPALLVPFAINRAPKAMARRLAAELGLDHQTLEVARRGMIPARFRRPRR